MKDRIIAIMHEKDLSASQFAEAIGVQRATISHIVNGRNNPSLDIVMKILDCYEEINSRWLLTGQGEMCVQLEENRENRQNTEEFPIDNPMSSENRKNLLLKPTENSIKSIDKENVISIQNGSKKISKIMVFYTDNTFDTFVSEKSIKDS